MSDQFTAWFHSDTPPVRVGVYERGIVGNTRWFAYWDGKWWRQGSRRPRSAYLIRETGASLNQGGYWRGMTKAAHRAASKGGGNGS